MAWAGWALFFSGKDCASPAAIQAGGSLCTSCYMVSSPIYCSACGVANPFNAAFCYACGQPLQGNAQSIQSRQSRQYPAADVSSPSGSLPDLLQDRYALLDQLGQGGFGAAYRAQDTKLGNRIVVVKEMSQTGLSSQEIIEATDAFKHEALLLASLMHPGLPRIYDHFTEDGHWYLVMDFIEGETLEERLEDSIGHRMLQIEDVLTIGIQLCNVLNYLHTRQPPIIFRDLKPANIMLTPDGNLYLIDFGIARLFKPGQVKDTIAFGSPGYAAPEQYGKAQTTTRADMYGLGATLHQLLTGDDPSETPFSFSVLHTPFPELDSLIMQMVSMDPRNRPSSMAEVKQELEHSQNHLQAEKTLTQQSIQSGQTGQTGAIPAIDPNSTYWQPSPSNVSRMPTGPQPTPGTGQIQGRQDAQMSWEARFTPPSLPVSYPANVTQGQGPLPVQGMPVSKYSNHIDKIRSVAWSPDGTRIVSASNDGTAQVWEAISGRQLVRYSGHNDHVNAVAWSPDGQFIVSGSKDKTVQVWDSSTGMPRFIYQGHAGWIGGSVNAVAWSPDGTKIASASIDKTVQVWNADTGEKTLAYRGHSGGVLSLAWSPDSTRIVSGGYAIKNSDGTIHIWDVNMGHTLLIYRGHRSAVSTIAWSPDGTRIVSSSSDVKTHVWDAHTGSLLCHYDGHPVSVWTVAWSPDGQTIASGSSDSTVQLWDASTGDHLFTYQGHSGTAWSVIPDVRTVAWSPDGQYIASGGSDNTVVQVWLAG